MLLSTGSCNNIHSHIKVQGNGVDSKLSVKPLFCAKGSARVVYGACGKAYNEKGNTLSDAFA